MDGMAGMGGMDMGGGHDSGDTGIGSDVNHAFAHDYWYICATVVGILMIIRAINYIGALRRLKAARNPSIPHPTRPDGPLSQIWATATALIREIGHPQYFVSVRFLTWITPLPLGRILVLFSYWAMILYFMTWQSVVHDSFFYERLGYRNAWVTICQLPMLFLLSTKVNVIGFLIGTGHERLNWLHRWVARTMFVSASVHGWNFWTEWVKGDFVDTELEMMPMVKYGLGAWGILLWNVVVGLVPIRRMAYELWVLQHVASSIVMLVLLYWHIPTNAQWLFWMAVSFLVFDRAARWAILVWQNIRIRVGGSPCQGRRRIGHQVTARAVGDSTTVVTIKDVHFNWSPGQHVYLWIPSLGPLEAHPYTVACARKLEGTCCCNSIQLIVRKHAGFSKRIHTFGSKSPEATLTGFLSGPYGVPPRWDIYETMVLIGASTGASFTVPLLESAAEADTPGCVRRMDLILIARTYREIEYYVDRARRAADILSGKGVSVNIHLAITGSNNGEGFPLTYSDTTTSRNSSNNSDFDIEEVKGAEKSNCCCAGKSGDSSSINEKVTSMPPVIREYTSRPDIEDLIRYPVEAAGGETAVVVCGGPEVVARTRNCVSKLSDERAVHKGTGAQGIYLHVEEYSF